MIKRTLYLGAYLALLAAPTLSMAAPNPASQDWVLQQIAYAVNHIPVAAGTLTAADWSAVCVTGSVSSPTGCFGNASSAAFARLNDGLGNFTSYAGVNMAGASGNTVFIKAFLAGTNTPLNVQQLTLNLPASGGMIKCDLFTQAGNGVNGPEGINSDIPSDGNGYFTGPQAPHVIAINATAAPVVDFNITYNSNSGNPNPPNPSAPLYFMCVGVDSTTGSTPHTIGNVTIV